jgi:hypothetical protein
MDNSTRDYRAARRLVRSLGMSISDDGVAFTVCGGQLVGGQDAPAEIQAMNGWTVDDVAREVVAKRRTDENWPFAEPAPAFRP